MWSIRPWDLRLRSTLSTAPPLISRVSGSGRTAPSSCCRRTEDDGLGVAELGHGMISVAGGYPRPPTTLSPAVGPGRGGVGQSVALLGVLALLEGAVCDPLQQLCVVSRGAHVVPRDLIGAVVK